MNYIDWIVLASTLIFIVVYGVWKTKGSKNIEGYLLSDKNMRWGTIGLSIMATQASAITFLSTPGQAYMEGMGFVQFYFGLPIAVVLVCATLVPIYHKLKVFTAYEYLEGRFDLKTRLLTSALFMTSRGLAAGITIYAPAIILSTIIDLPLNVTILIIGVLVIIYTVSGGTKAVSQTHKQQMVVIFVGMVIAFFMLIALLPDSVSMGRVFSIAGHLGKMEIVDFSFDLSNRYTIWSGIFAGVVLHASYFGTDQSQVQRYLGGASVAESRFGLLLNGLVKVPMQFFILLVGVMVFVFYQFERPPVFFNEQQITNVKNSQYASDFDALDQKHQAVFSEKRDKIEQLIAAIDHHQPGEIGALSQEVKQLELESKEIHQEVVDLIAVNDPEAETKDADYIFIGFVTKYLPHGLIGLLLAVIFSAAMSSTSSELNALASTTIIDYYKRLIKKEASDKHYLTASKVFTALWGVFAILFALFSSLVDNLIQAVNILGSLFYGVILGIFVLAFGFKYVKANAVFTAAIIGEVIVVSIWLLSEQGIINLSFLWLNLVGCAVVIFLGLLLQVLLTGTQKKESLS
jgi:Na+/proline symporter